MKIEAAAPGTSSYNVTGSMKGNAVLGWYSFNGPISATMGCSALFAQLKKIMVTSPMERYELEGEIKGTFHSNGGTRGFRNGTLTAKDNTYACTFTGTWTATAK